jgi:hypothetical protein
MKKLLLIIALLAAPLWAQITYDTKPQLIQSDGTALATLAYRKNVTNNNLLVVWYECFSGGNCATGPSISDTLGSTWTSRITQGSTQCGNLWAWTALANGSGANTATITNGGSFQQIHIAEYSGVTNTLDVASTATGWTNQTTITSPSITPTVNGDLILSDMHTCNSGGPGVITPLIWDYSNTSPDSMAGGYKVQTTAAATTAAFSWGGGSSGNSAIFAMKAVTAVTVSTNVLPDAATGTPYSVQLNAEGGTGSYTWTKISGASLPCGLSLSSGGLISGTPTCGNGAASMTFQATDGGSNTATKALTLAVGTSFNTPTKVQSMGTTYNTLTVTAGNTIVCSTLVFSGGIAAVSSSRVTWTILPLAVSVGQDQATYAFIGKVNSTGTDTQTVSGSNQKVGACTEFSNIQPIFEENVSSLTSGTAGANATVTSNAATTLVSGLLWSVIQPYTAGATETVQSPFSAGSSQTTGSFKNVDGYYATAPSGSNTVSWGQSGNTAGFYGILLTALRPTISGTAPTSGVTHHSRWVY